MQQPSPASLDSNATLRRGLGVLIGVLAASALGVSGPAVLRAQELRVFPNAESVEPRAVGSMIPNATVRSVDGEVVDLAKKIGDRGALLVFYRGGW